MEKRKSYVIFTIEFFIACIFLFLIFLVRGKSLLRYCDGLNQYFYTLCYYGEWLRDICRNLFVEHRLQIPLWDMSIGYGADILTTLHYYGLGDPLNLLAVFADRAHMEYLYTFLLILRLYLAGISFMALARYHGCREEGIRIAALVYCFSGWTILSGLRWVEFLTPMIFLPLLILGIDRIYRERSPLPFCICTALAAVTSFYFFYMICFFLLIYGIAGYFLYRKEIAPGSILKWFGRFSGYFLLGAGMGAFLWLPVSLVLLGESRMSVAHYVPLFFPRAFYLALPVNFIISSDVYNSVSAGWGFAPVVLPAMICLFFERKTNGILKVLFLLSMAIFCIPWCNHMLNGFSYVAHRWAWASALVVSFCVAKMWPAVCRARDQAASDGVGGIKDIFYRDRWRNASLTVIALCEIFLLFFFMGAGFYACANGALTILCLLGPVFLKNRGKALHGLLLLCVLAWTGLHSWRIYDSGETYGYESFADRGTAAGIIESENPNVVRALQDTTLFRYDSYGTDRYANWNLPMLLDLYGTQFYYSITDSVVFDYYQDIYMPASSNYSYQNLDGRAIAGSLAGVKYFLVRKGEEQYLPYGYDRAATETEKYSVYENRFALPLGYIYDKRISEETWDQYTAVQKQYAMLQGCVTDADSLPEIRPELTDREAEFTLWPEPEKGEEGYLFEAEENGSLVLELTGAVIPDAELYVELGDIAYLEENGVDATDITVEAGEVKKTYELRTGYAQGYCGIHDLLFCMGRDTGPGSIRITFGKAGRYRIGNLQVIWQPMEEMGRYVDARRQDVLEEIRIDGNHISGKLELDSPGLLLLALPYHKGWTAWVDGQETRLAKANGMFMALEAGPGRHTIELHYRTRGLREGSVISLLSVAGLAALMIKCRKRKEPHGEHDNGDRDGQEKATG